MLCWIGSIGPKEILQHLSLFQAKLLVFRLFKFKFEFVLSSWNRHFVWCSVFVLGVLVLQRLNLAYVDLFGLGCFVFSCCAYWFVVRGITHNYADFEHAVGNVYLVSSLLLTVSLLSFY